MMGVNLALAMVPTLAELIETLSRLKKYDPVSASDVSVGVFNAMYSSGNLFAPLTGGILDYYFGYERTCEIMSFVCVIFALVFYFTMIYKSKPFKLPLQE